MRKLCCLLFVAAAVAVVLPSTARADAFTNQFTCSGNTCTSQLTLFSAGSGLTGSSGPYGTVTLVFNSTGSATVTFQAAAGWGFIDSSIADLNLSAGTSASLSSSTLANTCGTGAGTCTITAAGSGTVNGFGTFNTTYNAFDGTADAYSKIVFNITGSFTSASGVLAANSGGYLDAAHVANLTTAAAAGCAAGTSIGACTGFVTESGSPQPPPSTPEPASMALFGTGLVGIAGVLRRRAKK